MKALIVLLSSDLPHSTKRDSNTMYFVYDKQVLFDGQSPYSSNYSIVEEMPDKPALDRFFIDLSDGLVKIPEDYSIFEYARVQTQAMLDILIQAGTSHFFDSKQQYIDEQVRMLSVPFSDGAYQLVVDIPNDLLFNDQTILKYNSEIGAFEIYGETLNVDPLETTGWHGHTTDTVITKVEDGRIKGKVRISQSDNNIIKVLEDGIYAYPSNTISQEEFDSWKKAYDDYKGIINYYIQNIEEILAEAGEIISEEVVDQKIHDALEKVIPDLEEAIEKFDELAEKLDELYTYSEVYADNAMRDTIAILDSMIQEALDEPWADIEPEPEPEPDPEPEPENPDEEG